MLMLICVLKNVQCCAMSGTHFFENIDLNNKARAAHSTLLFMSQQKLWTIYF